MSHYDTLEIHERASPEVVRAAYRSLIQRYHPDRRPDDPEAARRAAALTEAYEVLSDPERRSAYDRQLEEQRVAASAAEAGQARVAPAARRSASGAQRSASPSTRGGHASLAWAWGLLMLVLLAASFWLMRPAQEPLDDWSTLRQQFSAGGLTEQDRRALISRRDALLQQSPELRKLMDAEIERDRESRTVDLLDAPLDIVLPAGLMRIPRLRLVLGSFDSVALRSYVIANRQTLVDELVKGLRAAKSDWLVGPDGEAYVREVIQESLMSSLGIPPGEDFASTWFESPGRYGVVAVLLPQRYRLQIPGEASPPQASP